MDAKGDNPMVYFAKARRLIPIISLLYLEETGDFGKLILEQFRQARVGAKLNLAQPSHTPLRSERAGAIHSHSIANRIRHANRPALRRWRSQAREGKGRPNSQSRVAPRSKFSRVTGKLRKH